MRSLTRTWEHKMIELTNMLTDVVHENCVLKHDEDDEEVGYVGEGAYIDDDDLYAQLEAWLHRLFENIEDMSNFCADNQLTELVRNMTPIKEERGTW